MTKYKGVNFKENSEMIMWYLRESDGYESAKSIIQALTQYNGITDNVVRQNLRKFEDVNMVNVKRVKQENIHDKKLYKIDTQVLDNYLDVKDNKGIGDSLYKPVSDESDKIDIIMEKMEQLIQENNRKSKFMNKMQKRLDAQEEFINHQQKKIEELESRLESAEKFEYEVKHRMQQQ